MKNKKSIIVLFILGCLLTFSLYYSNVKADSGWDSSYDSGGSYSGGGYSGGSWSSGNSWSSNDGGYSSVNSYGISDTNWFVVFIIFMVIMIILINIGAKNNKLKQYKNENFGDKSLNYIDITDERLSKLGKSSGDFKEMGFEIYKNIQKSWMNFDYEALRKYTTDEIYNTYVSQLDVLKLKKQKNIMSDFEFIEAKITDIREENGILNVDLYLHVKDFDYVVDNNKNVIRGTANKKMNIEYIITLVKKVDNTKKEIHCPNCGAEIDVVAGEKCKYCGTIIEVTAEDYVMSKKTCINQRME